MPGGHPNVSSRPQPRLHRPCQHGGIHRGPRAVRRSRWSSGPRSPSPARTRSPGRSGKIALKRAAEAWLPHEIVHRPKASFSAPLRAWVSNDLRDVIDDTLLGGDLVETGFLDRLRRLGSRRRPPCGTRGPIQADLAAAHARAVVPPVPSSRSGAVRSPRKEGRTAGEASGAELSLGGACRHRRPSPDLRPRRRARAIALLPDLHRHRDDEGRRVQDVPRRHGASQARPGQEGARDRAAAGRRSPPTRRR